MTVGSGVMGALAALVLATQPIEGRPTVAEIMADAPDSAWITPNPAETLYIDVPAGRIVVRLVPEVAPQHYEQVRMLTADGYYDGLTFYRVPVGFVAQGGDEAGERDIGDAAPALAAEFEAPWSAVTGWASLGHADGYAPAAGFMRGLPAGYDPDTDTAWLAHCQGAFAFGREEGRNTASTEFYVTLQPQRYLDRNLTVLGRVVWGFEHLASLRRNAPGNFGVMADGAERTPIVRMRLASQVPEAERTAVQVMDTASDTFAALIEARAARPSGFFYHRPGPKGSGHVDLCQMPVPARLAPGEATE